MTGQNKKADACFFSDGAAPDPLYVAIRDGEHAEDARAEIEAQWRIFRQFCAEDESTFLSEARKQFRQRLWEMRLACLLFGLGHALERPPKGGPDIKVVGGKQPVWVEATIATRGTGHDAVEEERQGATFIDREKMLLRYTNAIDAKLKQYRSFRERGIVLEEQPFVIAINAGSIPNADIEQGYLPDIVRSVFGIGELQFVVPVLGATGPVRWRHPHQPAIAKKSGKPISTSAFRDASVAEISALIFTAAYAGQVRMNGWDLSVVHNPFARVPLTRETFRFGREWWFEADNSLVHCYPWRDIPRWTRHRGIKRVAQACVQLARSLPRLPKKRRRISEFEAAMSKARRRGKGDLARGSSGADEGQRDGT